MWEEFWQAGGMDKAGRPLGEEETPSGDGQSPGQHQCTLGRAPDLSCTTLGPLETSFLRRKVANPRTALTRPDIVQPPPVQRPQVQMQESLLAPSAVASQPDKELSSLSQTGEGYASDEGTSAAMSTAGVGTLAALIGGRGVQAMAGTALGRALLTKAAEGVVHAAGMSTVYGIGRKLGWWGGHEGK